MALFGIYGSHTTEACPVNNIDIARRIVQQAPEVRESLAKNTRSTQLLVSTTRLSNTRFFG